MTLWKAKHVHEGEQDEQGEYITIRDDLTICENCIREKGWGFTVEADDIVGDKCELCGATE